MVLEELLRADETHDSITLGCCSKCGKEYALITGSNRTEFRNGKRFAEIGNPSKHGWGAFRCSGCEEVIEATWIPKPEKLTTANGSVEVKDNLSGTGTFQVKSQ